MDTVARRTTPMCAKRSNDSATGASCTRNCYGVSDGDVEQVSIGFIACVPPMAENEVGKYQILENLEGLQMFFDVVVARVRLAVVSFDSKLSRQRVEDAYLVLNITESLRKLSVACL